MIQLRTLSVALAIAALSTPAAAQHATGSKSLTHVVSVTVPARVKVEVSALSLSQSAVTAPVKLVSGARNTVGLALSVRSNQAWVLSMKAPNAGSPAAQWSSVPGESAGDASIVVPQPSSTTAPVILTISTP